MLLGVGYIIGPRIASVMVGGGMLTAPDAHADDRLLRRGLPAVLPPGQQKISDMSPGQISSQYVRYIGAGAVATGGILSMLNALPLIVALGHAAACAIGLGQQVELTGRTASEDDQRTPDRSRHPDAVVLLGCWAWWPRSPRRT